MRISVNIDVLVYINIYIYKKNICISKYVCMRVRACLQNRLEYHFPSCDRLPKKVIMIYGSLFLC